MVSAAAAASCGFALSLPAFASAKTINLNDSGHLRLTSSKGANLEGKGSASGSIPASIKLNVKVVSTNKVSFTVSISPKGGSLSGAGTGKYAVNGGTASFTGTLTINKGSGSYSKAKGALHFNGTIQRSNHAVSVKVSGKLSA
jgi:hypothetical protein